MATRKVPRVHPIKLHEHALDISAYLTAEYDDVGQASQELPAILEWLNECLQDVQEQAMRLEIELDTQRAKAYFELTGDGPKCFTSSYLGKATAAAIEHAVGEDPGVRQTREDIAVTKSWVSRLQNARQTLMAKIELVRSTESTRRAAFSATDTD